MRRIGTQRAGGTAAAIPGIEVAGRPAPRSRVAVAVMLVGAGVAGQAAAPIARRVLQAAL